jgi:hypothetical protein
MAAGRNTRLGRLALTFRQAMMPIFVFALLAAIVCWTAAWMFRDTFVFAATLLGLGCLPIVVAISAYLLVLVHKVEREG